MQGDSKVAGLLGWLIDKLKKYRKKAEPAPIMMYRGWDQEALSVPMQEQDLCEWCHYHQPWRMNECGIGHPGWDHNWEMPECCSYEPRSMNTWE